MDTEPCSYRGGVLNHGGNVTNIGLPFYICTHTHRYTKITQKKPQCISCQICQMENKCSLLNLKRYIDDYYFKSLWKFFFLKEIKYKTVCLFPRAPRWPAILGSSITVVYKFHCIHTQQEICCCNPLSSNSPKRDPICPVWPSKHKS